MKRTIKKPITGILVLDNILGVFAYLFALVERDTKVFMIVFLGSMVCLLVWEHIKMENNFTAMQNRFQTKQEYFMRNCDAILKSRNVLIDSLQTMMLRNEIEHSQSSINCVKENEALRVELEKWLNK